MPTTSVLLGAGASVDASLPLTVQLAERVLSEANSGDVRSRQANWLRALNFVYGAMIGFQSEDGSNPLQAVNIERLISALRLLQDPKNHEVAPFVASWKPGALGVGGGHVDRSLGGAVAKGINTAITRSEFFAEQELADSIAQIARAVTTSGNPRAFVEAEQWVLASLTRALADIDSVDYLSPIAEVAIEQASGIDVLTLNYDLTIETMAKRASVPVDRGIERWVPGEAMNFDHSSGTIRLYKLHGSLDWRLESPGTTTDAPRIGVGEADPDQFSRSRQSLPWIVVGDREKLATDGPTLALMNAAAEALRKSRKLVVVGYSFSDAHINAMIRDWMSADSDRIIVIVDTNWNPGTMGDFRNGLIGRYGIQDAERRSARVVPVSGTAASRLGDALRAEPLPLPEPYASAHVESLANGLSAITIRLIGPGLSTASAHVTREVDPADRTQFPNLDLFRSEAEALDYDRKTSAWGRSSWRTAHVDDWTEGQSITFYCRTPDSPIEVFSMWATRPDARHQLTFTVRLSSPESSLAGAE